MTSSHRYPESQWMSGLERATGSSSSTEAWEDKVDAQGRLFYVETSLEPNWEEIRVSLPVDHRRGNLGRKAGLSEKLLGIKVGRGGVIEANVGVEDLVQEGDIVHRVDGIPVQDRAGVEMTLSGIGPNAQSVNLHLLRKSQKVEEIETTLPKKPVAFSHQLLYFDPAAREVYKFPGTPVPLSGAFPTLHDALNNSFNSGAASTSITFNGNLHSVSYAQLKSGLLCVAISHDIVPIYYISPLIDQLRKTVEWEFGEEFDACIENDVERVSAFFNRFFHSIMSEPIESRSLPWPRLSLISDTNRSKLDTVLYRYEACELEDGAFLRTHHIIGSAVFVKGSVICSHLTRDHLQLSFLMTRQERVFNSEISRVIAWRPVFISKSSLNFLLAVSRGDYCLVTLLEVNAFCTNDGSVGPDPFVVDWAEENLTMLKNVLASVPINVLKDFLVLDERRGFYVAESYDAELWTVLRKRRGVCSMLKSASGYLCCQTINNITLVNRQAKPLNTIEHALEVVSGIDF
ncbi:protein inturned-like [Galendromus occidentalis]|uniref:Protein inturned-like n=1 Tax=Galendromus occidentalis TaxID=34638 RepID=A0AAJ7SGP0_9ACAR|nr:protein inturned-like [Galendromus occidentalis]